MAAFDPIAIRSVPLFPGLAEERLSALLHGAHTERFGARALVIEEGGDPQFLHVLLEGSVELFTRLHDEETTITVLRAPATFLPAAVLAGQRYLASVRAISPVNCLMIPAGIVRNTFDADPAFAHAMVSELWERFQRLLTELKHQKLCTSIERLADWLLRADAQAGGTGYFTLPVDKRTLASWLGMTPENLSRNLKALSAQGVMLHGREVTLTNPTALSALALRWAQRFDPTNGRPTNAESVL